KIWICCAQYGIPLVYASSAATYGMGEHGYVDDSSLIPLLKPLNPYGESKNNFDNWVLTREEEPPFWAGVKFFNVYGPNEYHKGRMASVIYHAHKQIQETSAMNLFRSHNPNYKDGMQLRDFIYVKDVINILFFMMQTQTKSGIYNVGTGKARAFLHLVQATFKAMGRKENINFIDTPLDIRDKYQYFTEADMRKLRAIGYTKEFTSLEDGVQEYVQKYLEEGKRY
ncbi:MAG: ADP-glyceromanno-heptose 6-epimerase, partial [Bacteroidales bacterium]